MSADELELTFIRCTNCKSLMPSAAEKCGMCGFQRSEESTIKSRQRLRQQSDLNIPDVSSTVQISSPILEEEAQEEKDNFRFKLSKPVNETKRDYLNLSPQKSQEREFVNTNKQKPENFENEEDLFEDENEDYDDSFEEVSEKYDDQGSPRQGFNSDSLEDRPKKRKRRRKKKPRQPTVDQTAEFSPNEKFVNNENLQIQKANINLDVPKRADNIRYNLDQGSQAFENSEIRSPDVQNQRRVSEMNNKNNNEPFRQDAQRRENPRFEIQKNEFSRNESVMQDSSRIEPIRQQEPEHRHTSNHNENKRHEPFVPVKENIEGKLLGWLVNYSMNGKGVSFELRSGRRFVGRQALRQDDLIIPDSALSTPHCLLQVEDGQMFIQDLMSENGTFIKSSNSNEFLKKDASVKLNHGDIVRFGSYELIICLVPKI